MLGFGNIKTCCNPLFQYFRVLRASARSDLHKRYAGTMFGLLWVFIYPVLFLSVYLFLYLVVFKAKYPNFSTLDSVIYIFSGLIPYMAFMESINTSAGVLKSNIHLIKNVIMPIELIPIRVVAVAMITELVGLGMIIILSLVNHSFTWHLLLLPLAMLNQLIFLMGVSFFIAPLGLLLPDLTYFVNILVLLLMFVSPIGFMGIMLSEHMRLIIYLNPIYYELEPFRAVFLPEYAWHWYDMVGAVVISVLTLWLGCQVFEKFKRFAAEYE